MPKPPKPGVQPWEPELQPGASGDDLMSPLVDWSTANPAGAIRFSTLPN